MYKLLYDSVLKKIISILLSMQLFSIFGCKKQSAGLGENNYDTYFSDTLKDYIEVDSSFFGIYKVYAVSENRTEEGLSIVKSNLYKNGKSLYESSDTTAGYFNGIELVDLTENEVPELMIHSVIRGSLGYDISEIFKFENSKWKKLDIKELFNTKYIDKFRAHDKYFIRDRKLYNEFQLYNDTDANCCPSTGRIRTIEYKLKNDTFFPVSAFESPDPDRKGVK